MIRNSVFVVIVACLFASCGGNADVETGRSVVEYSEAGIAKVVFVERFDASNDSMTSNGDAMTDH